MITRNEHLIIGTYLILSRRYPQNNVCHMPFEKKQSKLMQDK